MLLRIVLFALLFRQLLCLPPVIRIGGLFAYDEEELEAAFRFAIERINEDKVLLPKSNLVAQIERVSSDNPYEVGQKVCNLISDGVVGIIGPTSEVTSYHVRSTCDVLEIPHIELTPDIDQRRDALSINMHPRPEVVSNAFLDVARGLGWDHMAIAYDVNEGLVNYQEFLRLARDLGWSIKLYQFDPDQPFRDVFLNIKKSRETNIILDVKQHNLWTAMKQAQQIGIMTERHNWIIASLDLLVEDITDFLYSGARITGFRLVEDHNAELTSLLQDWTHWNYKAGGRVYIEAPGRVKTSAALVYDAVKLLASALEGLDKSQRIDIPKTSCEIETPWSHGTSLVNYMRPIVFRGISGLLAFNEFGHRTLFTLDVFSLTRYGAEHVGYWTSNSGLNISARFLDGYSEFAIQQKTIIVSTVENDPFTMRRMTSEKMAGNLQYEGYAIELIEELSQLLGFKYEIRLCKDNKFGSQNPDGTWNGMIGELIREEADIAIVDLTITKKRQEAVDFTLPFMTTGVSILFTRPTVESSLFGFLSPFTMKVWVCLMIVNFTSSFIFYICGQLSPYEWDVLSPCSKTEEDENECDTKNSAWFIVGSLMQQGADLAPKAFSTRLLGGVYYFFTMIIIASYTANLAAFLTIEDLKYPFTNIEELANQKKIEYGCTASGSTRVSFRDSPDPILRKVSANMEANPNWFIANNKEGLARVKKGGYALFMEGAAIEYIVERECSLTQIGGMLDSKGYGIATRRGSPIRHALSRGILKLQEKGTLHILYERWWKQKRGGGSCQASGGGMAAPMAVANVGGVFVVLFLGGVASVFICIGEMIYQCNEGSSSRAELFQRLKEDFWFACRLSEYRKPNRNAESKSDSKSAESKSTKSKKSDASKLNA